MSVAKMTVDVMSVGKMTVDVMSVAKQNDYMRCQKPK
jgi:hypothetical protein